MEKKEDTWHMTIQNNQKRCDNCKADIKFSEYCLYHFSKIRHFCNKECFVSWVSKYIDFLDFEKEEKKDG